MIFLLKFVFFVELIMLEFCRLFGFFFFFGINDVVFELLFKGF